MCVSSIGFIVKDDAQLIDATLAGQSAAFGELVTKYQDRLYHSLLHVVGSSETARDVAQDAFVQAFVKLDTFKRSSTFFTWLYRIAFNRAISHQRKEKRTVSVEETRDKTGDEPIDQAGGPETRMLQSEQVTQVRAAIADLGDEYRAVLVLREMDDCSYETIGEILNLPIGTVRSRLHRARLQLRDALSEVLQEDSG